jgi:flagellar hook-length control protein FliK
MTALPIIPPSKTPARPPGPKGASPPPGADGDFAALLSQTSARTASAEGPKNRPAQPESRRRDAAAAKDDNKGAGAPEAQAAAAAQPAQPKPAADAQGQTPSGADATHDAQGQTPPQSGEVAPAVATPAADTAGAPAAAAQTAGAAAAAATATGTTTGTAAPPSTAAQTAAAALAAQPGSADGAPPADGAAAPANGTPAGKLQIPTELLNAKADANGGHTKDFKNGDHPKGDLPPAPTLPPTTDAAAAPTSATAAASTSAVVDPSAATAPAPAITTQAQPAATPQTAVPVMSGGVGGAVLTRASVLQTAERVQELVRIATTRAGNARATLQLRPAERGQVDVHLRTTRNGLVATIAAHEQVGHDALQQAGNELRRTLEDKGVQLHSLDLQLGAGQHGFSNQGDARQASSGRRGAAASHDLDSDDDVAERELTITHAPSTPAGALVDVQA